MQTQETGMLERFNVRTNDAEEIAKHALWLTVNGRMSQVFSEPGDETGASHLIAAHGLLENLFPGKWLLTKGEDDNLCLVSTGWDDEPTVEEV